MELIFGGAMDISSLQSVVLGQFGLWSGVLLDHAKSALVAAAIFILGLAAAEAARYLGTLLLASLRWDRLCEALGLAALLRKYRADVSPAAATGEGLFWLVLISGLMLALGRLDFAWLTGISRAYFELLPAAGNALLILALAWLLGRGLAWLLRSLVAHPGALLGAALAQALSLGIGLYTALVTLGLDRGLAEAAALVTLAAASFGIALGWALNRHALFTPVVRVPETEEDE